MGEFCRPPRLVKSSTEVDAWLRRLVPQLCGEAALHLDLQSGATVQLDRRRMRRAIEALCENALQAAEPEEEAEITVRTRRNGTKTYIMVEDCGPGMDAETARHALEPLYSTRSTRLGLGLPLARMVAQRHGGRLSIETSEGEGACVTICLPVARREQPE
jgi:two-component system sensor histidine kinase FlrB